MRANGLAGYTKRRRVKTTVADKRRRIFADLLRRRFTANRANDTYVGDITYLPIADGSNMYLDTVIANFSTHAGWSVSRLPITCAPSWYRKRW